MSMKELEAVTRWAQVQEDVRRRHDRILALIVADEKARDVRHEDLRADVGILLHVAMHGSKHVPYSPIYPARAARNE